MVNTVQWANSVRIDCCISVSVRGSTLVVASSSISRIARARQINCFWPTEKSLLDETGVSSFEDNELTFAFSCTFSSESHNCESDFSLKGSRLRRMVPENSIGFCCMIDNSYSRHDKDRRSLLTLMDSAIYSDDASWGCETKQ